MVREFQYTNDMGYHKTLSVDMTIKNGKYPVQLWSRDTGDFCGSGDMTKDEVNDFLKHYGVDDRIE